MPRFWLFFFTMVLTTNSIGHAEGIRFDWPIGSSSKYCRLQVTPENNINPWTLELQKKLEAAREQEPKLKAGEVLGCSFDISSDGKITNLQPLPNVSNVDKELQEVVYRTVMKVIPLANHTKDFPSNKIVRTFVIFDKYPYYSLRQEAVSKVDKGKQGESDFTPPAVTNNLTRPQLNNVTLPVTAQV